MRNKPVSVKKEIFRANSLKNFLLFFSLTIWFSVGYSQDSNSLAMDTMGMDSVTTAAAPPNLSITEQISGNKVLFYSIAVVAFLLIISLTFLSSMRKSKSDKTPPVGYRKPGGHHHHHHHKHRVHR